MQILAFYFSGTGNTWWVTERLAERIRGAGSDIEWIRMEKFSDSLWPEVEEKWRKADMIGVAYPIYASTAPKIVKQFLAQLLARMPAEVLTPKPALAITTMELFSGDGALILHKPLRQLGLQLQVAYNFQMNSNLGVPGYNYNPCPEPRFARRRQRTLKKMDTVVTALLSGKKLLQHRYRPLAYLLGALQRMASNLIEDKNGRFLGVDATRCTQCMQCVNNCPVEAISFDGTHFAFSDACTACYRCYNFCSAQAITVFKRSMNPKRHRQHQTYIGKPFY